MKKNALCYNSTQKNKKLYWKSDDRNSSVSGTYRENSIWWKLFMQKVHEDHSRAVRRRWPDDRLLKRHRKACVKAKWSETLRWNRVKAPLGTRLRHCISRCFFVGNLIINHLTNKITNVQAYISVIIHEIYNMFEI